MGASGSSGSTINASKRWFGAGVAPSVDSKRTMADAATSCHQADITAGCILIIALSVIFMIGRRVFDRRAYRLPLSTYMGYKLRMTQRVFDVSHSSIRNAREGVNHVQLPVCLNEQKYSCEASRNWHVRNGYSSIRWSTGQLGPLNLREGGTSPPQRHNAIPRMTSFVHHAKSGYYAETLPSSHLLSCTASLQNAPLPFPTVDQTPRRNDPCYRQH